MTTANQLDLYNEEQYKEIFMTLVDNGDWEYTRLGFGEDHVGLYMVDLDDSGEPFRDKIYINEKFSVSDVLAEGVDCGVFEKYEAGGKSYFSKTRMFERYPAEDLRGDYGVRVDADTEAFSTLVKRVTGF